jgi:ectoine hydroxylase
MKLTDQQLAQFNDLGYIFIPECFAAIEVQALRAAADEIFSGEREEIWREKNGAPRTAFACHRYNEACRILGADPRLVEPLQQVFGEACYIHQFKINAKAAFNGEVWQWHQDFTTWHQDDGMPEPRAMNIAVFIDEVFPYNGPLMLIPCSHRSGALPSRHDRQTTSYPLWTLDQATVTQLVERNGLAAPTGKPGGLLMFQANMVHGSSGNITPYPRRIVYLTLSAVSNAIRKPTRPEFIAQRDFTPVAAGRVDALMNYAERVAVQLHGLSR